MTTTEAAPPSPTDPAPDGAVDALLRRLFGRSWRTGVSSRLLYLAGLANVVLVAVPDLMSPRLMAATTAATLFVAGAGFHNAKDDKVTGARS